VKYDHLKLIFSKVMENADRFCHTFQFRFWIKIRSLNVHLKTFL
jgi:hypothetical protein